MFILFLYCTGKEDFPVRILMEFDNCDRMLLGEQGAVKIQCLKEVGVGMTRNEIRRKFCINDAFRSHLQECIQYKIRTKPHYLVRDSNFRYQITRSDFHSHKERMNQARTVKIRSFCVVCWSVQMETSF